MKINIEVEDKRLAMFLLHFRKKGLTWMVYNMRTRKWHDHLDFKELSNGLCEPDLYVESARNPQEKYDQGYLVIVKQDMYIH